VTRHVRVATRGEALAPVVLRASDPELLAWPGEPALAGDSPARALRVAYPSARTTVLGLSSASWLFVAASLAWGFALRRPLGVRL
jgi:hypothetical protein